MARSRILFIPTVLALGSGCTAPNLCGDRVVWAPGSERVKLSANDRLFVCGDPEHPAWSDVPPRQSARFLRSYLESKGYLESKIDVDYDRLRVTVDSGPKAIIREIEAKNAPPGWKTRELDTNLGQPLEKSALDRLEDDSLGLLKGLGYACSSVRIEAHPDGRVILDLSPGELQTFVAATSTSPYPIPDPVLTRFEPFSPGDRYDVRKTILAGRRLESEVATSAAYSSVCRDGRLVRIDRTASFGGPRSWEIGLGASTEEYPLAFVRWKSTRLWSTASSFQASTFGSNLRQTISAELRYYYSKDSPRLYLRPRFSYEHRDEPQYQTYETKVAVYQGRTIDTGNWTLDPEVGLSLRRLRVLDSIAAARTQIYFSPEISLGAHTNDFELYGGDPRQGFDGNLGYAFLPGSEAESISLHRLLLQGTYLLNYRGYVEPRWVLGARFLFGSIFTTDGTAPDPNKAPIDWFFPVGGDANLRGFGRNTLPNEELGAGSAAVGGVESRWPHVVSAPLEPLVFLDVGWLGDGNARFRPDVYYSPGFGLRSATPIGVVRATWARGLVPSRGIARSQLFVSFGTEF